MCLTKQNIFTDKKIPAGKDLQGRLCFSGFFFFKEILKIRLFAQIRQLFFAQNDRNFSKSEKKRKGIEGKIKKMLMCTHRKEARFES